jgi:hypothetical protein
MDGKFGLPVEIVTDHVDVKQTRNRRHCTESAYYHPAQQCSSDAKTKSVITNV